MNILLVGSQHGDELLGEKLYAHIRAYQGALLPFITYRLANPAARRDGTRFTETDMNRSYVDSPQSYEEVLAKELLGYISKNGFDLVLDLHTTRANQAPCLILGNTSDGIERFVKATRIKNVVIMRHSIVERSLIGNCPNALSVEVEDRAINHELLDMLCEDIKSYIGDVKSSASKHYFKVTGLIDKDDVSEEESSKLVNFAQSTLGYYPVLSGEDSYKTHTQYLGFKAKRITCLTCEDRV